MHVVAVVEVLAVHGQTPHGGGARVSGRGLAPRLIRRAGGLADVERTSAVLRLVQTIRGLGEAGTRGSPAGCHLFQQRHIKHGFLRLLPLKPPTRHRVGAPHRPARIDTQGRNRHTRPTTFSPYLIPCLEPFHASNSRRGAAVSRSQSSRPPHALPQRASCFPCAGGFCKFCAEPGSSLRPCRHGGRQHALHGRRRARCGAPRRTPPAAIDHRCAQMSADEHDGGCVRLEPGNAYDLQAERPSHLRAHRR